MRALPTRPMGQRAEAPLRKPGSRSRVPLPSWGLYPPQLIPSRKGITGIILGVVAGWTEDEVRNRPVNCQVL